MNEKILIEKQWSFTTETAIESVVLAENRLVCLDSMGLSVFILESESGVMVWRKRIEEVFLSVSVGDSLKNIEVFEGIVYLEDQYGNLAGADIETGGEEILFMARGETEAQFVFPLARTKNYLAQIVSNADCIRFVKVSRASEIQKLRREERGSDPYIHDALQNCFTFRISNLGNSAGPSFVGQQMLTFNHARILIFEKIVESVDIRGRNKTEIGKKVFPNSLATLDQFPILDPTREVWIFPEIEVAIKESFVNIPNFEVEEWRVSITPSIWGDNFSNARFSFESALSVEPVSAIGCDDSSWCIYQVRQASLSESQGELLIGFFPETNHKVVLAFPGLQISRPILYKNSILISVGNQGIRCYERISGDLSWEFSPTDFGYFLLTPEVSEDNVYFGTSKGFIGAVDYTSGKLLWSLQTNLTLIGPILVHGDLVIVSSSTGLEAFKITDKG